MRTGRHDYVLTNNLFADNFLRMDLIQFIMLAGQPTVSFVN